MKLIFQIILITLLLYVINIENIDNTRPYGTDKEKMKEYKNISFSEENGVQTFWGKYLKTDTVNDSLKKIKILSTAVQKDIIWRKAMIGAIIITLILSLFINNILFLLLVLFLCFNVIYFSINYYVRHILFYRINNTLKHLKNIKKSNESSTK